MGTSWSVFFERRPAHSSWLSQLAASGSAFFMVTNHKRRLLNTLDETCPPGELLRVSRVRTAAIKAIPD